MSMFFNYCFSRYKSKHYFAYAILFDVHIMRRVRSHFVFLRDLQPCNRILPTYGYSSVIHAFILNLCFFQIMSDII